MGTEACTNCTKPESYVEVNTFQPTTAQQNWARAIETNSIADIKALHLDNWELLDEPIQEHNTCAIHIVVQHKKYEILKYLLQSQFDVNVQETFHGNTALHMASQSEDKQSIEQLFSYSDTDDKIKNYQGKEAYQMCSDQFKREYIKAKERGKAIRTKLERARIGYSDFSDINYLCVGNGYTKNDNRALNGKYRTNGQYLTTFAAENGVDIDEMAMFVRKHTSVHNNIWSKLIGKKVVTTTVEIEYMLEEICALAVKDKRCEQNSDVIQYLPTKGSIEQLSEVVCDRLKQSTGEIALSEEDFNATFHSELYAIHEQILGGKLLELSDDHSGSTADTFVINENGSDLSNEKTKKENSHIHPQWDSTDYGYSIGMETPVPRERGNSLSSKFRNADAFQTDQFMYNE